MNIVLEQLNKEIELELFLNKYDVAVNVETIISKYNHHSKYYHNFTHVLDLLSRLTIDDDALIMAILFHDISFDVRIENHEEASAEFFMVNCHGDTVFKEKVGKLILATQFTKMPVDLLEKEIVRLDREILYKHDINSLLTWENSIFKEYQHLSITEYKAGREAFLNLAYKETNNPILLELRDIIIEKRYKVGFYPGSFNPFHIGHFNILKKAEKSFDKVVIGVGVNYDKKDIEKVAFPEYISNREIITYSGLITTEIEKLNNEGEVFVVRGLRNAYDLQHEESLRNVIKDFLPNQEFVYYFCDKEYEHISSSVIRDIKSRGKENEMVRRMVDKYTVK